MCSVSKLSKGYLPDPEIVAHINRILINFEKNSPPATKEEFDEILQVNVDRKTYEVLMALSSDSGLTIPEIIEHSISVLANMMVNLNKKSHFLATRQAIK